MKLSSNQLAMIKAYVHGLVVTVLPLAIAGVTNPKWYAYAVVSAVIVPALRALDKKDSAFGLVADAIETNLPTQTKP